MVDDMTLDALQISGDLFQVKGECRLEVNIDRSDWNPRKRPSWSIKPETNLQDGSLEGFRPNMSN